MHPFSVIPPRPLPESATQKVDLLVQWMTTGRANRPTPPPQPGGGLRFAFYGRTSTTRHQDRVSSQGWQCDMANDLITGRGQIVAEYFDAGTSRRVPWRQRSRAAQREVLRARHRVLAAMHNQATQQGRHLGGRPPYGYRLVDAGPHPNLADARWGRRLQRIAPDQHAVRR